MRLWTLGAKVADVDREVAFIQSIGGQLVLDEELSVDGRGYRLPLLRLGDKYLHLGTAMVYEDRLSEPLGPGLCHLVLRVGDLEAYRTRALRAGAAEVAPAARIEAGFGVRDIAFLRSPGGVLMEFAQITEDRVPPV
jgi:hypothetical protein